MVAVAVTRTTTIMYRLKPFNFMNNSKKCNHNNNSKCSTVEFVDQSFPSFLPKEINNIKDPFARHLAFRIQRLPVKRRKRKKMVALMTTTMYLNPFIETNSRKSSKVVADDHGFPSFLPDEVHDIKDPFARHLAMRIERFPVQVPFSDNCINSSCITPLIKQGNTNPVVLLHGFDSSCLEWRCTYPLLEEAGVETWAVDILGWGFSDLEQLPSCDVESKRAHLYQFWKSYIKRPMILVGPSLGAAIAIDFAVKYPETVSKLILIDASVYTEGLGGVAELPKILIYAGLALLKSVPLRLYVNKLVFNGIPFSTSFDWMNISRLPCLMPWWRDATLSFMASGGYNVTTMIKQVRQPVLILWGEDDRIISYKLAVRLHSELQHAILRPIPECGHIPHVEKPEKVASLIVDFAQNNSC